MLINHRDDTKYYSHPVCYSTPLYGHFKLLIWKWLSSESEVSSMTYHRFRLAWLAFHKLIDFGQSRSENFVCDICTEQPEAVVCDGITLSFEKRFLISQYVNSKNEESELAGCRYVLLSIGS